MLASFAGGLGLGKKPKAKEKKRYYEFLRIEMKDPPPTPIEDEHILRAYLNLLFRAFRPLHVANVTKKSTGTTALRSKRLEDIIRALTAYLNSLTVARYDPILLVEVLNLLVVVANDGSLDAFTKGSNVKLGEQIKETMCDDEYVSMKTTYVAYHDPPMSAETKPAKIAKALALHQVEYIQRVVDAAVTFMQACNYVDRIRI